MQPATVVPRSGCWGTRSFSVRLGWPCQPVSRAVLQLFARGEVVQIDAPASFELSPTSADWEDNGPGWSVMATVGCVSSE